MCVPAYAQTEFTPQRERARHDALVERARRAAPGRPLWVLCPREPLAAALEARVARAGGGFVAIVSWDALLDAVEEALDLPSRPAPSPIARISIVEAALSECASYAPAIARAMAADPFGVAAALLGVLDELRMAGWDGDLRVVQAGVSELADAAERIVRTHLEVLAVLVSALEKGLESTSKLDTPARLRRALDATTRERAPLVPTDEIFVEGVDRLAPVERALLERITASGTRVDVAPWVVGWHRKSPRPRDLTHRPATALEAYARCVEPCDTATDDDSIVEVSARDPGEEAEAVARWLAESSDAQGRSVALLLPAEPGYPARVARALERYGLTASYATSEPASRGPLWQVVRASVRLAWRGPDAIDLATVLSAPGAGIWGADRDRLCARLREHRPTSWAAVRQVLARATDPALLASSATDAGTTDAEPELDPERVRQLEETRRRVESLVDLWEGNGPFVRLAPGERLDALKAVVEATLERFANPMRLQQGLPDARTVAAWTAAASEVRDALRAVLERMARAGSPPPADDPSAFLAPAERLLGMVPDALNRRRADAIPFLIDCPFAPERPDVLLVLGFQRGRYPAVPEPQMLLGPLEREALARAASVVPGLAEIADEGLRVALAERDTRRALSLPTRTLVLISPRRDASGKETDPALSRRDLLAAYPRPVARERDLRGPLPADRWCRMGGSEPPRSARAALCDAVAALGAGDPERALAGALYLSAGPPERRDLLVARWRPDRDFRVGELVRHRLRATTYSASSLDSMLKCRYAFLARTLLNLRNLPLARAPSLGASDRSVVARAALRALEALVESGIEPNEIEIDSALDEAIAATVPWALRGEARLDLEELRHTLRSFVGRYLVLRTKWGLLPSRATFDAKARMPVRLSLATSAQDAPREIEVDAEEVHVEERVVARGDVRRGIVVDLHLGGIDRVRAQRALGLGVAAAILPLLAEVRGAPPIEAFASLSLSKPEGEVLAASAAGAFAERAGDTAMSLDGERSLDCFRAEVLERLAHELDALASDGAEFAPHSRARRAELEAAGARSCEYCVARLACRFPMGAA